jgi:DNA polymerase-3 subunit epsilon
VAQAIARRFAQVLPAEATELHEAQAGWAAAQAANFQEYMRRVRDPNFVAEGAWPIR